MVGAKRLNPKVRKDRILQAAVDASVDHGYHNLTRLRVAEYAGVTVSLINYYYSTMPKLRRAVMRRCVQQDVLSVIASGLVAGDKQARKATSDIQTKALNLHRR